MDKTDKYSCARELGAEVAMVIISLIVATSTLYSVFQKSFVLCKIIFYKILGFPVSKTKTYRKVRDKNEGILLSLACALFIPLMSFEFSQAKQYNPEERAQIILVWMVLTEFIRVRDGDSTWEIKKSAEQLVRLIWLIFLVFSYNPHGLVLFIVCVVSFVNEVLKGIAVHKAKNSYLIGRNPKLIHNYMKRVMLHDDMRTTPMNKCDYIVMGEENHDISVCDDGYRLGDKKSNSVGKLTIGRVFQLNSSEDEVFTMAHPDWRDKCLSIALAKMLRRRFVKLPLDEDGNSKALEFVLEGLIDYVGSNEDIPIERRNQEQNPIERVFDIIQDELRYVSGFSNPRLPIYKYFGRYVFLVDIIVSFIMLAIGGFVILPIDYTNSIRNSLVVQDTYSHCFFHIMVRWTVVANIFSFLDIAITWLLWVACIYVQYKGMVASIFNYWPKANLDIVIKRYIQNPAKWNKYNSSVAASKSPKLHARFSNVSSYVNNVEQGRYHSILDSKDGANFCIKVHGTNTFFHVKWIKRKIGRAFPTLLNTDVKEAILQSLRKSGGQITNGKTALRSHEVLENVNQVCRPSGSTTEAILIWHIATTLFHYQKPLPQSNNNAFKKERHVTLALSTYCYYLVASLPQLLPDEVEWTKKMYESAREEIFAIDRSSRRKPTIKNRCSYLMGDVLLDEKSLVGMGAKLAQMLVFYADNGKEVWTMLSEFWAEMLLFTAPSDNVMGHEEILEKGELITQLWALLTHAGIFTRPQPTQPTNSGRKSNEVIEVIETDTRYSNHASQSNVTTEFVTHDIQYPNHANEGNATNEVVTDIQYPNHASEVNEITEV